MLANVNAEWHRLLALAVFYHAVKDFTARTSVSGSTKVGVTAVVAADAGRFLLEREDEITEFWFRLAGRRLKAFRANIPETLFKRLRCLEAGEPQLRIKCPEEFSAWIDDET